jgi:hypothetical protein
MPEKTINEIPPFCRDFFRKGEAAMQRRNWDYAAEFFNQVLRHEPAFYQCCEAWRRVQLTRAGARRGWFMKLLGAVRNCPRMTSRGTLRFHLARRGGTSDRQAGRTSCQDSASGGRGCR